MKLREAGRLAGTIAAAVLGAQACVALGTPLPWFIGPLLVSAACTLAGASRDQMLAMPVATWMRLVASSRIAALTKASRLSSVSGYQRHP